MDEVGDSTQQSQSPVKTEWNSRCVIFTYFQGDISKEVDEHFSRALGLSVSSLQELSPSNHRRRESQQQEEVILTNETDLAPNQWRFSSPWTKPHPEANFGNGDTNGSVDVFEPVAVNPYPITTTRSPLSQPDQPWQSPTLPYSNSLDLTYPSAFSVPEALVPVPEPQQEEKCESLISFLQQDRSIALPQQPVSSISWEDGYMAHTAGGSGLHFNLPPSSSSAQPITPGGTWGTMWNAGECKYCPPNTLATCKLLGKNKGINKGNLKQPCAPYQDSKQL
ncbi:transcription cofactor vestigial-like protein 1 [Sorex fumeus]|uniref:transcription cofactor vestigial-like protein 1 n=1 Tax=Sorex fumeus TaxID=62283 RepID=UPI0024ADBB31|nr:transcription cofactor vestigial-like protein 1 [Sorex fumeus]